jgi:hypothetical protein
MCVAEYIRGFHVDFLHTLFMRAGIYPPLGKKGLHAMHAILSGRKYLANSWELCSGIALDIS